MELGVEAILFTTRPFDSANFCDFLKRIPNHSSSPATLVLDNASYHRSHLTIATMKRLGFKYVFNAPWHPEYQAAELGINTIKTAFKKLRLQAIVDNKKISMQTLVRRTVWNTDKAAFKNACEFMIEKWRRRPEFIATLVVLGCKCIGISNINACSSN
jgi:hypothetical protein